MSGSNERVLPRLHDVMALAIAGAIGVLQGGLNERQLSPSQIGVIAMEVVEYPRSLQWVGDMQCPHCKGLTPAWRSSGMSQAFPHFYCDRCSNVIQREKDQHLVWNQATPELLDAIAADLPECPCGGRFRPGANPKCAHCGTELKHQDDPVKRLHDPHMIVIDGACVFSDRRQPYRVRINGK